jgi:hypothetical protein
MTGSSSLARLFCITLGFFAVPTVLIQSVLAQPFGQPRNQPHTNANPETQITWHILTAMPQQIKRNLPSNVRSLRNACDQWGGVKLTAGKNIDGTVLCAQDQQSNVNASDYRSFGTDYVVAAVLVSLHSAIEVDASRRSQLLQEFRKPEVLRNLVRQGIRQSLQVGLPLVKSSEELLINDATREILTVLKDPNWTTNLYGNVAQYEILSQNFCQQQGMTIQQSQSLALVKPPGTGIAPELKGYQRYATCWMESGLPSQMIRDLRISRHLRNPKPAKPTKPNVDRGS